jgi:hypothetical protein
MANFLTIKVDPELHRLIETNRMSGSESPNDVVRRLLQLWPAAVTDDEDEASLDAWSGSGVTLPEGTQLRMTYNRQTDYGEIRDGAWLVYNTRYDTPSGAASAVARNKQGLNTKLDGWRYWQIKRPGERQWTALAELRKSAK